MLNDRTSSIVVFQPWTCSYSPTARRFLGQQRKSFFIEFYGLATVFLPVWKSVTGFDFSGFNCYEIIASISQFVLIERFRKTVFYLLEDIWCKENQFKQSFGATTRGYK